MFCAKSTDFQRQPNMDARVVELVDSLASGASARKGVRVRLPPRAPKRKTSALQMFFFLLLCPDIMGNLDPGWLSLYNSTIIFRSRLVIARRAKPDAAIRNSRPQSLPLGPIPLVKGKCPEGTKGIGQVARAKPVTDEGNGFPRRIRSSE